LINSTFKFITGKEIILYDKHRQTEPLVSNQHNKEKYCFINIGLIWNYIPFKTSDKRKHRIMYFILNLIQPKYILSVNWISKRESLYKVWTANHSKSSFIVVQHGSYAGGLVTDIPHKYTKCDVFLTWGSYFVDQFKNYNAQKKVQIICFGNSKYNDLNRELYQYKNNKNNKILILPTALDKHNLIHLYSLLHKLKELHFEVVVKPHGKQGTELNSDNTLKYPVIEGVTTITGALYTIMEDNEYDFVISDHSTSLLDAIFFKNKVLYFDPNNLIKGYKTNYSNYLVNLFDEYVKTPNKDRFYELISIDNQEALLNNMLYSGTNTIEAINFLKMKNEK
jgi:hypothetical protein